MKGRREARRYISIRSSKSSSLICSERSCCSLESNVEPLTEHQRRTKDTRQKSKRIIGAAMIRFYRSTERGKWTERNSSSCTYRWKNEKWNLKHSTEKSLWSSAVLARHLTDRSKRSSWFSVTSNSFVLFLSSEGEKIANDRQREWAFSVSPCLSLFLALCLFVSWSPLTLFEGEATLNLSCFLSTANDDLFTMIPLN